MSSLFLPRNTHQQLAQLVRPATATTPEVIAVSNELAPCFPWGGLRRGDTIMVGGSSTLTFTTVAHATQSGLWCGVVALPQLNLAAGEETGVDLSRIVLVQEPSRHLPEVAAALLDALDIVILGIVPELTRETLQKLSARTRQRRKVLLLSTATPPPSLPGIAITLDAVQHRWGGATEGFGYLEHHQIDIRAYGHGRAARSREHTLSCVPVRNKQPDVLPGIAKVTQVL
ncbi:MAG: hypothetical protein WD360_00855 [Nitriliruptoraceae bacterium]